MDIILDSNIIVRSDFLLKARPFELLFDFMEKTKSKFIMTQLVWEEILSLYANETGQRHASFQTARRRLGSILLEEREESTENNLDIDLIVAKYKQFIKQKMGFSAEDIVPYQDRYLQDLVPRAINRRKPFTDKGEEFRDAVLWLTVLDIAESKESKTVVFISANIRQYASEKYEKKLPEIQGTTLLHSELLQEVSARDVNVLYYTSVDGFLKSQATPVDFITKDWLISQLNQYKIGDDLVDILNEYAEDDFKDELDERDREISVCGVGDALINDIRDFFVYETSSGLYFVIAVVLFKIQGSFDYEQEIEEPDYDLDVDDEGRRIAYAAGSYTRSETGTEDYEAEVKVGLSIILRDKSLDKVHIENWEIVNLWG